MNNECLTETVRMMLADAGIVTKLVDNSIWHKVYKDTVFNETMFYSGRETFAVSMLKEPYLSISLYKSNAERYVSFLLDTVTVYPRSEDELVKCVKDLCAYYKKYIEAYSFMKEELDKTDAMIRDMLKTTDFTKVNKYVNAREKELTSQLNSFMKISEIM